MSDTINVKIIRPTYLRGHHLGVGRTIALPPLDAHALRLNGKAELVDSADSAQLQDAVRRADLATASASRGFVPSVQRPW